LRASSTHRSEEMLSNQMLSGIPEVDLGIEWVISTQQISPVHSSLLNFDVLTAMNVSILTVMLLN
jgi:hypothetical protein